MQLSLQLAVFLGHVGEIMELQRQLSDVWPLRMMQESWKELIHA